MPVPNAHDAASPPRITFANGGIDRRTELRGDPDALIEAADSEVAGFVPFWQGRCLINASAAVLPDAASVNVDPHTEPCLLFLGERQNRPLFSVKLDPHSPPPELPGEFVELRQAMTELNDADAALIAYAHAMHGWQRNHQFCGRCGTRNELKSGGFVMDCPEPDCSHRSFPRLDPAIIVLVCHADQCLLGRQPQWPADRYSTIAGFVEPGESLEDAVCREVHEETNVHVGPCHYFASQPWPFPASLMLGFHAEAETTKIALNDSELADARWLSRDDIRSGTVTLPPSTSIAFRLIEAWFDDYAGPGLAELGITGPPFGRTSRAEQQTNPP